MGLFNKTKISVSSVSMPLINKPVNKVTEAAIYAILKNQSIPMTIVEDALLGGIGMQAERAYKYGYEKYSLGLPSGSMTSMIQVADTVVEGIIEAEIGQSISLLYNFIDTLSVELALFEVFMGTRQYNPETKAIGNHSFQLTPSHDTYPVLLDRVEYLSATNQIKVTYSHKVAITSKDEDGTWITYSSWDEYFYETYPVPAGMYIGEQYCIAAYKLRDTSNQLLEGTYYWLYRIASNTHPVLTRAVYSQKQGGFFPLVPIRRNNVDLTAGVSRNTELYTTSKRLLQLLGLRIDDLASQLNANPDIEEIDHAYVMMGIDIQSQVPESLYYLTEFFDYLGDLGRYKKADFQRAVTAQKAAPTNMFTTVDRRWTLPPNDISVLELDINFELQYNYITSTVEVGSIGPIGTATSTTVTNPGFNSKYSYQNTDTITFRLQITPATYKQVIVQGLIHVNTVYKNKQVLTFLGDSLDPDNNNFIVPVHYGIANRMQLIKRNMLYQDALRLHINSYTVTKLKWYQTSFFRFLVAVVGIVVTLYTVGTTGPFWAGLTAAMEVGAMAVVMYLMPSILWGIAISVGMKLVAKVVGAEWAAIIGAAMAVYSIVRGNVGSFKFLGSTIPTAQACLQAGMALISASQDLLGEAYQKVMEDMNRWSTSVDELQAEIDKANELLHTDSLIDPLTWLAPERKIIPMLHESPTDFYNRTVHTGNPGALTLDAIGNFHTNMLTLPKAKFANVIYS